MAIWVKFDFALNNHSFALKQQFSLFIIEYLTFFNSICHAYQ